MLYVCITPPLIISRPISGLVVVVVLVIPPFWLHIDIYIVDIPEHLQEQQKAKTIQQAVNYSGHRM